MSRAPESFAGGEASSLPPEGTMHRVREAAEQASYKAKAFKHLKRCGIVAATVLLLLGLFVLLVPVTTLDDPVSLVLLDQEEDLLGATISEDEQWRFPPIDVAPERLEAAILHFEDRRFRRHPGVDPLALARAIWTNLREGEVVSGASTITMQVVRLSRKGRQRTLTEKLVEAVLAIRLEMALDKDEILATYISHAPYGGNVVGVEAAAWRYLGRSPHDVSWAEAALLAVLPNSPSLIHPGRNRELLRKRRDKLLRDLMVAGLIDEQTLDLSVLEAIPDAPKPLPRLAPHLLARFQGRLSRSSEDLERRIVTTIDGSLQKRATEVAARHRKRLEANRVHNAAALILDIDTGKVLAYIGNAADPAKPEHAPDVDCIRARRSPGSALKPLLYAAMLENGEILPSSLVADIPIRIGGFAPENFDRTYSGAVPAKTALARSLNVPAVRLLSDFGVDRFAALLRDLGMTTLDKPASHYGLSLVIGGSEATLWELTGIYAGLARSARGDGQSSFFPPTVEKASSPSLDAFSRQPASVDAAAAFSTLEAMVEVERPGADAAWRRFASARSIAWKTGTSWGHRDAWAIGISSRFAVGVWVGNASGAGRPGNTGHLAAAPLLMDLFDLLPQEQGGPLVPPRGLTRVEVCAASGLRAGPRCALTRMIEAPRSALGTEACHYCRIIHCDEGCRYRVHTGCASPDAIVTKRRFVLPPAMEWFYAQGNPGYRPLPPWREDCREEGSGSGPPPLSMVHPRPNGRLFIPRQLDGERGRAVFTAAHRDPATAIHWHLGNRYLGTTRGIHQMELAPAPGPHLLTLVDEDGEQLSHPFSVVD